MLCIVSHLQNEVTLKRNNMTYSLRRMRDEADMMKEKMITIPTHMLQNPSRHNKISTKSQSST